MRKHLLAFAVVVLSGCSSSPTPSDAGANADGAFDGPLQAFDGSTHVPAVLGYFTCDDSTATNHSNVLALVRATPPSYPFLVDTVELLAYFQAFNTNPVTIPSHHVIAWAGPNADPSASPTLLVDMSTPTSTVPGCTQSPCAMNGATVISAALSNTIVLTQGQALFIAIDNDNNVAACPQATPAGNNWYSTVLAAPYTWAAQDTSAFTPGIRAKGYSQSDTTCPPSAPTACPSSAAPAYCTAGACQ